MIMNATFHLRRGSRTLSIVNLGERFVGLIDGRHYITAKSPDRVVRFLLCISTGADQEVRMEKKGKAAPTDLVAAAKRFAGDVDQVLTSGEEAAMLAARQELPRPSKDEIREAARRLAKQ